MAFLPICVQQWVRDMLLDHISRIVFGVLQALIWTGEAVDTSLFSVKPLGSYGNILGRLRYRGNRRYIIIYVLYIYTYMIIYIILYIGILVE